MYEQHVETEMNTQSWPYLSSIPPAILNHQAGKASDRRPRSNIQRRNQ